MATQETDTLSQCDSSTVACACAAHALDGEHRQQLAVQVLAGTEPVTKLAERVLPVSLRDNRKNRG